MHIPAGGNLPCYYPYLIYDSARVPEDRSETRLLTIFCLPMVILFRAIERLRHISIPVSSGKLYGACRRPQRSCLHQEFAEPARDVGSFHGTAVEKGPPVTSRNQKARSPHLT